MKEKTKVYVNVFLSACILLGLSLFCLVKPETAVSVSERRKLKTMPEVSMETIFGKRGGASFMDEFEIYAKDQFPMRESFRTVNAVSGRWLLGRCEINDLYVSGGHIVKMDDGIHSKDIGWAVKRFDSILQKYITDNPVYMAVIPDKNCLAAPENGIPYADAKEITELLKQGIGYRTEFIDLTSMLEIEDYYRTDTHWRQESIQDIAEYILEQMGRETDVSYQKREVTKDFKGVYHGQAALPIPSESLNVLTWEGMDDLIVQCYDSGKAEPMKLYDYEKAEQMDPYEVFLSGSRALITIDNPNVEEGELIVFRDSFGSSLIPLLTPGYRKITLVDIRYISPSNLSKFMDFEGADILFLYSSSVLNNSIGQILN